MAFRSHNVLLILLFIAMPGSLTLAQSSGSSYGGAASVQVGPRSCWEARGLGMIYEQEAISKKLDNDLKKVQIKFAKQHCYLQGRAESETLRYELRQTEQKVHAARCEQALEERLAVVERRRAIEEQALALRRKSLPVVDLSRPLDWPTSLNHPALASHRDHLEAVLSQRNLQTGASSSADLKAIRETTAQMYKDLKALKQDNQVQFEDLVEARRYIDALHLAVATSTTARPHLDTFSSVD